MTERTRCTDPTCGAYDGHHGPLCKLAPLEYKAAQLESYYHCWREEHKRYHTLYDRHKKDVTFWQGKFSMVKQENNALRAKLKKQ